MLWFELIDRIMVTHVIFLHEVGLIILFQMAQAKLLENVSFIVFVQKVVWKVYLNQRSIVFNLVYKE